MSNKNELVWKIKNSKYMFSDQDVIDLIRMGKLKGDDYLMSKDMKDWIKLEDSIYQFYLKENKHNENL